MSMFEVLQRFGTWALLRFTTAAALFVLLHLIRIPLVLAARLLEFTMRRANAWAARVASTSPTRPINQFFPARSGFREEAINVHA